MENKLVKIVKESRLEQSIKDNLIWHFNNQFWDKATNEKLFTETVFFQVEITLTYPQIKKYYFSGKLNVNFENKTVTIRNKTSNDFIKSYNEIFDIFLIDFLNGKIKVEDSILGYKSYELLEKERICRITSL